MAEEKKPPREKPPRVLSAVPGSDGRKRCPWPGSDPLYVAYHDEEWGAPEYDDRALFEKLVLDGFQAGLSWITILRKRPAFRAAFEGFEPERIARWDAAKKDALMQDPGIVRNRAKIEATHGARPHLSRPRRRRAASPDICGASSTAARSSPGARVSPTFRPRARSCAPSPRTCAPAAEISSGPTIIYAFMQATGMVNDHLVECCRHEACRALARDLPP